MDQQDSSNSEITDLEKELREGLDHHDIKDISKLHQEIEDTKKEIAQLEKEGRQKKVSQQKTYLEDLERLLETQKKIESLKAEAKNSGNKEQNASVSTILAELKKKLTDGLNRHEIKNVASLEKEIEERKSEISDLEKADRKRKLLEKKNSLEDLEILKALSKEIEVLEAENSKNLPCEEYDILEKKFKEGLTAHDIQDPASLEKEIENKKSEITKLEKEGRHKKALERRNSLEDLERLLILLNQIEKLKNRLPKNDVQKEYETLNKELREGLDRHEIKETETLEKEIEEKRKEIEKLEKEGRQKKAIERKGSLEDLERLQLISKRIEEIKAKLSSSSIKEIEIMERELRDGLDRHDLKEFTCLEKDIEEKKSEITKLEKEGRQKKALERRNSLEDLERLLILLKQIETLKNLLPKNDVQKEYETLNKELREGLDRHEIKEAETLEKGIGEKRKEIEKLEKEGRQKKAIERKKSLEDLERLLKLSEKVQALNPDPNRINKIENAMRPEISETLMENPAKTEKASIIESKIRNSEVSHNKKIKKIEDVFNDFSSMPICSEKYLIRLIYLTSIKLLGKAESANLKVPLPNQIEEEIKKEFDFLKERLKIEELETSKINELFEKSRGNSKSEDWKETLLTLEQLLKKIRPLDIQEMFRLISKAEETAEVVKGQDIILFLGGTGSGKSTVIHYLAGSEMQEQIIRDLTHIAPVKIKNPFLNQVHTSPFAISETRYITSVPVNILDVGGFNEGKVVLCDSPGFEDTNGPEVDIANGIGIIEAVKRSKSVKPVVLISYRSTGDRLTGLKDLAYILVGMIPGIENQIRAFSYFFTKYPKEERKRIHATLKDIRETMSPEEKSNKGFYYIFTDMLRKTSNGAMIIDPLSGNPGKILDELAGTATIQHPDEVFHFSITEKSKAILQEQLRRHQLSIMAAIKRSEYAFIKYKLDELKNLHKLLNQDNISQVYSECIRHLSQHLTEEYHQSISLLNRCLTHENALTVEDIRKYQTSIACAESVEDLRNDHLDQEVIKSSAYLQNLNNQIDSVLLKDFERKDIDDPLLKTIFDKLKLLSKSFSNVEPKYNEVCGLVAEKFDKSVKSIETSVLSDEFDKCAEEIAKISQCMALGDHLSLEDMKTKYLHLQEYFLSSIRTSTEQLYEAFAHKQLEESHVKELSKGVSRLETIKKTVNLHFLIRIEDVKEIHNSILKKIMDYFVDLTQKINDLFKMKRENSFVAIEDLMKEITLIRTIPEVDFKTSQFYYSTLEALCGFIQELRRDIDAILVSISQQNDKINYKKLFNYLNGLQGAKWIGEYKTGVYSDLMKAVEELILQHMKGLQSFIKDVDLDLDSPDKLDSAFRTLQRVNQMKPLEKIFPDSLGPEIEKTNSLFKRKTKETLKDIEGFIEKWINYVDFKIAEENFLEKWKHNGYQNGEFKQAEQEFKEGWNIHNHQTLGFKNAEKSLKYLITCKDLKLSFGNHSKLFYTLEDIIGKYRLLVQNEMTNCFNAIVHFNNADRDDLSANSKKLLSRLEEIYEIRERFPEFYIRFDNEKKTVEEWIKKLTLNLADLSDKMAKLSVAKQNQELNNKLLIANAFSLLDDFLTKEKYIEVYRKYQDIFFAEAPNVLKAIIDAIRSYDYSFVFNEMSQMENMSDALSKRNLDQSKKILNNSIENLIEETQSSTRLILIRDNAIPQKFEAIVQNLKKIQNAKTIISHFIDNQDNLTECVKKVQKTISKGLLELCQVIEGLINSHNFYEVDIQRTNLNLICDILGTHCELEVIDAIKGLEKTQQETLTKLVHTYSEMDLNGYLMNPPKDVFEKFSKISSEKAVYNQALNTIKEKVFETFRKEIAKVKEDKFQDDSNPYIRNCESALNCLPDTIKPLLTVELKICRDEINKNAQDHESELQFIIRSADLNKIKKFIEKCQSSGLNSSIRKVEESVMKDVYEIKDKVNKAIDNGNIREAFLNAKKLFEFKSQLGSLITEIDVVYSEGKGKILKAFGDIYSSFSQRFFNNKISNTEEIVQSTEKDFSCLFEYIRFRNENKNQSFVNELFQSDFDAKLNELNTKISCHFKEYQSKYEEGLKTIDFSLLRTSLVNMKIWGSLLIKIRSYADSLASIDILASSLNILNQIKPYSEMMQAISDKFKELRDDLFNTNLINDQTKMFSNARDKFYEQLNKKISTLLKFKDLMSHDIPTGFSTIEQECIEALDKKLMALFFTSESLLDKFLKNPSVQNLEYDTFNINYNNLVSFEKHIKVIKVSNAKLSKSIDQKLIDRVLNIIKKAEQDPSVDNVAMCLINTKTIAENIISFKAKIDELIDEFLSTYKANQERVRDFAKLGTILNRDKSGIGHIIISENKAFQGYSLSIFTSKTQKHGIEYVLNKITGDLVDKDQLNKRYKEFQNEFQELTQQYLHPNMNLTSLISSIKLLSGDIKHEPSNIIWDGEIKAKVPKLMAHIFALWTLKNASHYFEAKDLDDRDNYLFQPHAAQVIAIFRTLGIGDKKEELKNNIVQIGTGEGKSVVLAVTASVLGLLGFDVSCACHSEYLSSRDYTAFQSLFDSLNLLNHVHYGTFNKVCERVINENVDIRKIVENLILENDAIVNSKKIKRPKILLIDEVDIFFSKDFYGNTYTPLAHLKDPIIIKLIDLIWNSRKSQWNVNNIKVTQIYQDCRKKFQNWDFLIEEAVKNMSDDIKKYESHGYLVKDDKIGYKDQDNIVFNICDGYKTLFAYYHEHEKGRISKESLDANKSILVRCASFSYAEIPQQFKFIMGVTGTLKTLSDPEKNVIKSVYKITKNTFMPSVFGANNLSFHVKDDIMIENNHDYLNAIIKEIQNRITGKNQGTKRAVLVFFESKEKLMEFYQLDALSNLKDQINIITEEASTQEKDSLVKRATASGQITLLTKIFGRGTDFICRDQIVSSNGGVHVLQTFLSEELSEEVQIKGRTARQGDSGSYSMILLDTSLEKFMITKENLQRAKKGMKIFPGLVNLVGFNPEKDTVYDFLNEKRNDLFRTQYEQNTKNVISAKKRHETSLNFLDNLNAGNMDFVQPFLRDENRGA